MTIRAIWATCAAGSAAQIALASLQERCGVSEAVVGHFAVKNLVEASEFRFFGDAHRLQTD